MDRWVKLYIKIWNSDMFVGFKNKDKMIITWVWFLTHCRDGKCTYGLRQIAKDAGLTKASVFRAVANILKAEQEVKHETNQYFSTIYILNWHKYQDNPHKQPKQEVKRKRNESETKAVHNKNKNKNNTNEKKITKIFPEVDQIIEHYKKIYGIKTLPKRLENIRAARDLLRDYGLQKVLAAIEVAHQASSEEYAPMIGSLIKLKEKYSDLQLWYKRNHKGDAKKADDEIGEIKNSLGKVIKQGGK